MAQDKRPTLTDGTVTFARGESALEIYEELLALCRRTGRIGMISRAMLGLADEPNFRLRGS